MTRLTRKVNKEWHYEIDYHTIDGDRKALGDLKFVNKLGQFEDVEEAWGIDLIKYLEAVRQQRVWVLHNGKLLQTKEVYWTSDIYDSLYLWLDCLKFDNEEPIVVSNKDYGKTWALTKEELEK